MAARDRFVEPITTICVACPDSVPIKDMAIRRNVFFSAKWLCFPRPCQHPILPPPLYVLFFPSPCAQYSRRFAANRIEVGDKVDAMAYDAELGGYPDAVPLLSPRRHEQLSPALRTTVALACSSVFSAVSLGKPTGRNLLSAIW